MKCQVFNCGSWNNNKASPCSFYGFPTNEILSKKWVEFCRREEPFNTKTSVICMKHFREDDYQNLRQFNMGLARRRLLKRDAVPSIYGGEMSAQESRLQDEFTVDYLLEKYNGGEPLNGSSCEYSNKNDNNIDISTSPISHTSFYNDDSPQEVEILKTEVSYYYDNSQLEVEALETEIETLKRENALLKKDNKKQRIELIGLKREFGIQQKRHAWEIETLQKRLVAMTNKVKNLEKKLGSMFTPGQIERLKSGSKKHIWSKKDIANATRLYAISPKAYELMYKKKFPLPAISTLRIRTKKANISDGE